MTKILPYTFGVEIECFGVPVQVVTYVLNQNGITTADLLSPAPAVGTPARAQYDLARRGQYDENAWVFSSDGSIRGQHPMEIKSPILKGAEGIKTLRKVVGLLRKVGLKVNESTGLHVHVGVKRAPEGLQHNVETVLEVLRRYDAYTGEIEKLVRTDRRSGNNTYCQPVKNRVMAVTAALGLNQAEPEPLPPGYDSWSAYQREEYRLYGFGDFYWESDRRNHMTPEPPSARRAAGLRVETYTMENIGRLGNHYDACSIAAMSKYGTIEFRQHQGSLNPAEVVNWVLFVVNHVEQARLAVAKRGQPKSRGRKPGLYTGLPMSVRTHFQKQIAKFGPRPAMPAPGPTAPDPLAAAAARMAASQATCQTSLDTEPF